MVDESGFLKKGTHSVGVKRQYSGTAGKVENCQMGTFLSYATRRGNVFLDRRLYLPEDWSADEPRRAQAIVPEQVRSQTKPEQAAEMLAHAWEQGISMRWAVGDEVYGESTPLRDTIRKHGRGYVLAGLAVTTFFRVQLSARFFRADTLLSNTALNSQLISGVLQSKIVE